MISEDAEVRRGPRSTAGSADTGYFSSQMSSMREPLKMLLTIRVSPFYTRVPAGPVADRDHAGTPSV